MTNPVLSLTSVALQAGDDPTKLVEGGGTLEIKVTSSAPFQTSQQVMIELTGTASTYFNNNQLTLTAVGEGLFSKLETSTTGTFRGLTQTGTGNESNIFAVFEPYSTPGNTGGSQGQLIIQKINDVGEPVTSFGTSGTKTIFNASSPTHAIQKLVFASDGSFAYQRGSNIELFDLNGASLGNITLQTEYWQLLCLDGQNLFVQNTTMYGADDINVYDLHTKTFSDSFSTAANGGSPVSFSSGDLISPSSRDQFGLTDDGKFYWRGTDGSVYSAEETGNWTPTNVLSQNGGYSSYETIQNNGKFYSLDKSLPNELTLKVIDADRGINEIYNVDLSGKVTSSLQSLNLVGVADDGSILLSASPDSVQVSGLPSGVSAVFKLKPDTAGSYQLDLGFGQDGILPSAQSITSSDIKATVDDSFLLQSFSSDSDLSIWSNSNSGYPSGFTLSQYNGKQVAYLTMPQNSTEASFFVHAQGDFLNEYQETLEFKLLPSGNSPTPPYSANYSYSVDAIKNTVSLTIEDVISPQGVDLNGPSDYGISRYNSGPNDVWYDSFNNTTTNVIPHFYNAQIVVPEGKSVDKIDISVKGSGTWSGSNQSIAEKFNLIFGYQQSGSFQELTPGTLNHTYAFKLALSETPSFSKAFFTQHLDGFNQLFSISQQFDVSTQNYKFSIASEDGYGMSSEAATEIIRNFGFDYRNEPMPTELHNVNLQIQVAAFDDSGTQIPVSSPDGDQSIFQFSNHPPEIYDATFHGQFIQLMFHSGPSSELNYDLADLTNTYDSWRGIPSINHFTLEVNGTEGEYKILEVIQQKSLLLVLDKALPANAQVSISYADPSSGDEIFDVVQSWHGNDANSFSDFVVQYGHTIEISGEVLSGAELGWNVDLEEGAYINPDFDARSVVGQVISKNQDQVLVEFHTTGWRPNPNFTGSPSSVLQDDPSAELVFHISLSKSNWSPSVGTQLQLSEALGYDKGYMVHSFKTILNTSSEQFSVGMTPSQGSITPHELALYNIPGGVPFSYLPSTGFSLSSAKFDGSSHDDFLGDPTNLGDMQINAGDGNDSLIGGVGNDSLNGGKGTDTVYVAGLKEDFLIAKTGANTFTLTPKTPISWDSGGTDQLTSIEKVQFDNGEVQLDSVDPQFNTTVTQFDVDSKSIIKPSANGRFDYLDLTSLSVDASGNELNTTFTVEADFNLNSGAIWVNGSVNTYDFSDFEGYIVSGSAKSNIGTGAPYDPIKVSTHSSENDIVLVKSGSGLQIDLGDEVTSTQDVLSFRGTQAGVNIVLEPSADSSGWVTFQTGDGSSEVAGADFVFGSNASDTITGFNSKANLLAGYDGNDLLTGGKASDLLFGGSGEDTLFGDEGNDTLIDLDQATLYGGSGKDQFVVRGANAQDVAEIQDLELSPEGLSRGGVNAQTFADRIIFNFSTAAFTNSQLASVVAGASGSLNASDYLKLRNAIELKVEPATPTSTTQFVVSAYLKEDMSQADPLAGLLGRVEFTTGQTLSSSESIRAVKLVQSPDFMNQIDQPIMDQMFNVSTPLDVTAPSSDAPVQIFSETVSLVFGLEKTDKFTVGPQPGEYRPVLIPVQINGIEYATRFQLGNADERVVGSHSGDTYQFVPSFFIDQNGDEEASQTFGNDVIVERGRVTDTVKIAVSQASGSSVVSSPASTPFDNTGRDVISLANETTTNTGVGIHDLLVGDLNLTRMQKGREGFENSLNVSYSDSSSGDDSLNDVNLTVYKQYVARDASFRVEDLLLLDLNGNATRFDLGQSFKNATSQGLATYDARDAILLARANDADTFKLVNTSTGEPDREFDVFLQDFDFEKDKVEIEGYGAGAISSRSNENGDSKLTLTLDNGTTGTEDDYALNLYFLDIAPPSQDDQWLLLKTA